MVAISEYRRILNDHTSTDEAITKRLEYIESLWLLKKTYEAQTEEAAKELEQNGEGLKRDLAVPYRTALAKATGMLKNPASTWDVVDVIEKHRLFFFLFEARLGYSKAEGYRTGNELSTTRLFEEFCDENSDDVDLAGIEPAPLQCECSVLPLNYRPVGLLGIEPSLHAPEARVLPVYYSPNVRVTPLAYRGAA